MLKNGWISGQQGSDIWYILIGTASIVCGAVSMQLLHIRLSVTSGHYTPLLQFAAVGQQTGHILSTTAAAEGKCRQRHTHR